MGVFSYYRDAKVAIEELGEAEFSLNEITLIARNWWRYHWQSELNICARLSTCISHSRSNPVNS